MRILCVAIAMMLASIAPSSAETGEARNGIFCLEQEVAEHIAERLHSAPGAIGIERAQFVLAMHGGRVKVTSIVNFHLGGRLEAPVCTCGLKQSLFASEQLSARIARIEQHVRLGTLLDSIIATHYYVIGSEVVCPLKPTS